MTRLDMVGRALAAHARRVVQPVVLATAAVLAPTLGCDTDKLLRVKDPDVVGPEDINSASSLPAALAAAIGDFAVGYVGNAVIPGQVLLSGLLGDEWRSSDTFPTRNDIDQRIIDINNSDNLDTYRTLQRARASAERVANAFGELQPDDPSFSEALSLAGFAYILFAENYCSGVPFSEVTSGGDLVYGEGQTRDQILARAIQKFDSAAALATAAEVDSLVALALVGKARAQLDLGQPAEAAVTAAQVPSGFAYLVFSSANTDRQNNSVWQFNQNQQRFSVADVEGGNGLPYMQANDPRVSFQAAVDGETGDSIPGFDGVTPVVFQLKYPERESATPLASSTEARLIEAEGALQGAGGDFVGKLNEAREEANSVLVRLLGPNAPPIGPIDPAEVPATADGQVDLLFRERAFDLWLTSHRLGDLRRLARQYGRPVESLYPVGTVPYAKGDAYGTQVSLPAPFEERNNPEYDPASCDATVP